MVLPGGVGKGSWGSKEVVPVGGGGINPDGNLYQVYINILIDTCTRPMYDDKKKTERDSGRFFICIHSSKARATTS